MEDHLRKKIDTLSRHGGESHQIPEDFQQIIFPFHVLSSRRKLQFVSKLQSSSFLPTHFLPTFSSFFPKVHASEKSKETQKSPNGDSVKDKQEGAPDTDADIKEALRRQELEALARAYIEQESGMERVKGIFKKDHKGDSSVEVHYITLALVQTFLISYFMRYVPVWRFAKQEFIRQHRSTVFRTRLEAVRRMQDQVSLKAGLDAAKFSAKITFFSASFLFLSQIMSSYRNKTSPLEYALAAGVTGGIARLHLGPKGFVAGSLLGACLGSVLGGITLVVCHHFGIAQEDRHLDAVISMLEVEKYIVGEPAFKKKMEDIRQSAVKPIETAS